MKRFFMAMFVAGALSCQAVQGDIVITEIMSSSAHTGGSNNADWFELTNNGTSAVDVTGWSWDDIDAVAGTANFGGIASIAAGESIVVTGETLLFEATWRTNWNVAASIQVVNLGGPFQNFGSAGDSITIFDAASAIVTSRTIGAATSSFSFEWDSLGNDLGLSVIGENGAYQATSNGQDVGPGAGVDVGSPGFAVSAIPEPGSLLLLTGCAVAGLIRRRR